MGPRILLLLPQLPQDPASGAARTAQTAVEMARAAGFEVRALAVTATERGAHQDTLPYLESMGLEVDVRVSRKGFRELRFEQRGIPYTLLDTGRFKMLAWEKTHGRAFEQLLEEELTQFAPDIVFTYGGSEAEQRRLRRIRRSGARVAMCVFNLGYFYPEFFNLVDITLTPSEYLAKLYRDRIGIDSVPLPTPIEIADIVAQDRDPIFVTMVNPSIEKGLFFFARLAEELCRREPKIAVLAIESRGTAGSVFNAGLAGGFDLRRHDGLMVAPPVPSPRDIYQNTRLLLVPSVWPEPSGRVVAEALVNQLPPLVSDRGGLAESANGAGFVLPLPEEYTVETRTPVPAAAVEPWIDVIRQLCFDEAFYQQQCALCQNAARMYHRENLAPRYVDFFRQALGVPDKR